MSDTSALILIVACVAGLAGLLWGKLVLACSDGGSEPPAAWRKMGR